MKVISSIVIMSAAILITVLLTYAISSRIHVNLFFYALLSVVIFASVRMLLLPFVSMFEAIFDRLQTQSSQRVTIDTSNPSDFDYSVCPAFLDHENVDEVSDTIRGINLADLSSGIASTPCVQSVPSSPDPTGDLIYDQPAFQHYCSPSQQRRSLTPALKADLNVDAANVDRCLTPNLNKRLSYYFE